MAAGGASANVRANVLVHVYWSALCFLSLALMSALCLLLALMNE